MNDLEKLRIEKCGITSIDDNCFFEMENLKLLDLSVNKLNNLKPYIFQDLESLVVLNLSNCSLTSISDSCFDKLVNLQELNLRGNTELKNIKPKTFGDLKLLRKLDLSNCGISSFINGVFEGLKNLEKLDLSGNMNMSLKTSDLHELESLKNLELMNCDFKLIEDGFFSKFENLEKLNLSECLNLSIWIEDSKSIGFRGLNSLLSLNLSACGIRSNDIDYFSHLKNLEKLNLENNDLKNLEPVFFFDFRKLRLLVLDEDQITHNYGKKVNHAKFKKELKVFIDPNIEVVFDDNYV